MSEREELVKLLFVHDVSNRAADTAPEIAALCESAADAILAAGYHKEESDEDAALDLLDAVLALHKVEKNAWPRDGYTHYWPWGEKLISGWATGCPTCRTEGSCPTRLAIEGGER
jgi:hypothetical protein